MVRKVLPCYSIYLSPEDVPLKELIAFAYSIRPITVAHFDKDNTKSDISVVAPVEEGSRSKERHHNQVNFGSDDDQMNF